MLDFPIHSQRLSPMSAGKILTTRQPRSGRRMPGSAFILIICPGTRRILYVGESLHRALGHAAREFLGEKWERLTRIVVDEFREGFIRAMKGYLAGTATMPYLMQVRNATGGIVACEIGAGERPHGQDDERIIIWRCIPESVPAQFRSAPGDGDATRLRLARHWRPAARGAIARVMHDTVAQDLFLCKGKLLSLKRATGAGEQGRLLSEALGHLDDSTTGFREVLSAFSTAETAGLDFRGALIGVMKWARKKYALDVKLRVTGALPELDPASRELLLSGARELLTNVFKHSGQKAARVIVGMRNGGIRLVVVDCGSGIAPTDRLPARGSGFGLRGIRERAGNLGGTLVVDSIAGAHTRVSLLMPRRGLS